MKVQQVRNYHGLTLWIVIDDSYLPVAPITEFIIYLANTEKSPFTIRSYANHLKLFWDYVVSNKINWQTIKLNQLASFIAYLRRHNVDDTVIDITQKADRKISTVNTISSCVCSFYQYHNQVGHTSIDFTESTFYSGSRYKGLLHHLYRGKPTRKKILTLKNVKEAPKTITTEQFNKLINNCCNKRDIFLVTLLFETGLRIGQALALRHEDIVSWDNIINIKYRYDNLNNVRNKSKRQNIIHVSNSLLNAYTDYVISLEQSKIGEYVFINLNDYTPLRYSAVRKLFSRFTKQCGFKVTPHMLRHSHATQLIEAGWDSSLIQKRLGHSSVQTTINTYAHIDNKTLKQAYKEYQNSKEVK